MESDFLTVDTLLEKLDKASKAGYGDMKIKCQDGYLREDEIGFNFFEKEVLFRGMLYNFSLTEKIKKFCVGLQKLSDEFWREIT